MGAAHPKLQPFLPPGTPGALTDAQELDRYAASVTAFLAGAIPDDRFTSIRLQQGCYGQRQPGVHMVRVKAPGGRLDPEDRQMKFCGALDPVSERRMLARWSKPSKARLNALALAAIRETSEETGILLGSNGETPAAPSPGWQPFSDAALMPDLSALKFFARAITPPGRKRRFDTRFFVADRRAAKIERPGAAGPDSGRR